MDGGLAQLARAPALQAGGHRFESDILHLVITQEGVVDNVIFDILGNIIRNNKSRAVFCLGTNGIRI